MMIEKQLNSVRQSIKTFADAQQRSPEEVTLLAVSKRHPVSSIRLAFAHQQKDFGENYLSEALEKQAQLTDLAITWHYIGSIQSNKTRKIAENFTWVHTVDSVKIAKRLSMQRPETLPPLNICLQINVDQENSKSGLPPDVERLIPLINEISLLKQLHLRGLMCIPAPKETQDEERQAFNTMQQLMKTINQRLALSLDTLSMGMSNDLEAAIAQGATIVRVGTAIFGPRP